MIVHAGVDISAQWFDICVIVEEKPILRRFENSKPALRQCVTWLEQLGITELEVALEPTGRYGELVSEYFFRRKYRVRQVNTLMFSRYAESLDIRGKTDAKDCLALAYYCKERSDKLRLWRPKTELEWELRDLQVLLRSLTKRSIAIRCQLSCRLKSRFVAQELEEELTECQKRADRALDRAEQLILTDEVLAQDFKLLCTIPGVGRRTALLLLTLIDFRSFRTSRSLACFLGLTKKLHESGSSVRGREKISKRGSKWIRAALFMPTRVARRFNPLMHEFAERQIASGKHDWTVQFAVMRKLVTMAWAVVVNQTPFEASYVNSNGSPT